MGPLTGFTVGVTADRRSDEQIRLLEGRGASCIHGPTIATAPLRPEAEVRASTERFLASDADIVVLTTGIGTRGWLEAAEAVGLGDQLRTALSRCRVITRGPKANGAASAEGLDVEWSSTSATYAEVVEHLRAEPLTSTSVAVQLDGADDQRLETELERAGASVIPVHVYRWSLPEDLGPAERLVRAVAERQVDCLTFTARPAVENLCRIARELDLFEQVVAACASHVRLFSIGHVCSGGIVDNGLGVPIEPPRHRLGALVHHLTAVLSEPLGGSMAGVDFELAGRTLRVDETDALLTRREHQVFVSLQAKQGAVASKRELLHRIWGPGLDDEHVVEVTIARLRRKLGSGAGALETVRRRGYRLAPT